VRLALHVGWAVEKLRLHGYEYSVMMTMPLTPAPPT
jgi:hypothetical protein